MYDYNRPHRYSLDRRTAGHTPRKYRCPQCGQPGAWVSAV